MANIFRLRKYQNFGLLNMQNMRKIPFANNKFSLRLTVVENAIF